MAGTTQTGATRVHHGDIDDESFDRQRPGNGPKPGSFASALGGLHGSSL